MWSGLAFVVQSDLHSKLLVACLRHSQDETWTNWMAHIILHPVNISYTGYLRATTLTIERGQCCVVLICKVHNHKIVCHCWRPVDERTVTAVWLTVTPYSILPSWCIHPVSSVSVAVVCRVVKALIKRDFLRWVNRHLINITASKTIAIITAPMRSASWSAFILIVHSSMSVKGSWSSGGGLR